MPLHIGKIIRQHLEDAGMTKSEFARRLGTSPQNVFGIFKRNSVDTDLLKQISDILNYDFFQYYSIGSLVVSEGKAGYGKEKVITASDLQKEIELLKKELELLQTENKYLKEIHQLMKEKQAKVKG